MVVPARLDFLEVLQRSAVKPEILSMVIICQNLDL